MCLFTHTLVNMLRISGIAPCGGDLKQSAQVFKDDYQKWNKITQMSVHFTQASSELGPRKHVGLQIQSAGLLQMRQKSQRSIVNLRKTNWILDTACLFSEMAVLEHDRNVFREACPLDVTHSGLRPSSLLDLIHYGLLERCSNRRKSLMWHKNISSTCLCTTEFTHQHLCTCLLHQWNVWQSVQMHPEHHLLADCRITTVWARTLSQHRQQKQLLFVKQMQVEHFPPLFSSMLQRFKKCDIMLHYMSWYENLYFQSIESRWVISDSLCQRALK